MPVHGMGEKAQSLPKVPTATVLNCWANSTSGFQDMITQLSDDRVDKQGNPLAISFIASYIACKFPDVYSQVFHQHTALVSKPMNAIQTAELIADARVSTHAGRIPLGR